MPTKKAAKCTKFARGSAAAFAVGVFLAGPAAIAAADGGADAAGSTDAGSAGAASSATSAPSQGRAGPSRAARTAPGSATAVGPVARRGLAPTAVTAPEVTAPEVAIPEVEIREVTAPAEVSITQPPAAPALDGAAPQVAAPSDTPALGRRIASEVAIPRPAAAQPTNRGAGAGATAPAVSVPAVPAASTAEAETALAPVAHASAPAGLAVSSQPMVASPAAGAPTKLLEGLAPLTGMFQATPAAQVAAKTPAPMAALHSEVQSFFIKVKHFLADLQLQGGPLGQLGANLEGALLVVRRTFFNHAPTLNPLQKTINQAGLVLGNVGGYDAEGDELTYAVTAKPQFGIVELSTEGKYVYKPGAGYTGSDAFTVRVVSDGSGVNLFNLVQGTWQAAEMTIKVGDAGPTHPLSGALGATAPVAGSIPPVGLYVTAPVSIEADAAGNPTVILTVKDDTQMTWQRPGGANGQIAVAEAWKDWDRFAAAAGDPKYVMMGVEFTLPNGTQMTAIINTVTATGNGDTYQFTGQFAVDPLDNSGNEAIDSFYDIIGASYQTSYENFRSQYGGETATTGFNPSNLDLDINSANVYFSNYTLDSYQQALAGTDPGVTLSAPQSGLQAAASNTKVSTSDAVTVTIDDGAGGFFEATGLGTVNHYRAAPPDGENNLVELTQGGSPWNSPVTSMISYGGRTVPVYGQASAQSESQTVIAGVKTVFFELDEAVDFTKVQSGTMSGTVSYGTEKYGYTVDGGGKFTFTGSAVAGSPNPVSGSVTAQPNGANSLVNITFDKALAADTASTALSYKVQTGESTVPGLVVGLGDGAIQQWTPGDPTDPKQAQGSWKELRDQGWQSAVNVLMPYKGRPDVCAGGCDGFLVGLNNGSVQQYNEARNGAGQPGWYELQGSGWGSAVRGMVLSKTDSAGLPTFAVGLDNGAVEQWNNGPTYGWTEIQKPGKSGWNAKLTAMMPYADGFVVGLDNGAVFQRNNDDNTWKQLQGLGWDSAVKTLVPYGAGFAVGLANGAVEHWTGSSWKEFQSDGYKTQTMTQYGSIGLAVGTGNCYSTCYDANNDGQSSNGVIVWDGKRWEPIQKLPGDTGSGWAGTPTTMTQVGNQLVVGLSDGSTQIWDGTEWTVLKSNKLSLADGALRSAVEFARSGGKAVADGVFVDDPGNIFFTQADQLQPSCATTSKGCDASFYAFTLKGENPYSLAGKSIGLGDNGQSLDLSYDVGSTDYGYVMVPNGIWKKLNPEKYAFAVLASVYTGPSITLNLGDDGVFSTAPVDLINVDYTCNLACSGGTGSYNVNVNVNVKVEGSLLDSDGQALTGELNGHTYIVPGMLIAYNTGGKSFQFGAGKYIDSDYSDFKKVNGVEIKPIITPSLTLSWGLFTSPNTPIIGEQSLFDLNLGYENPIALDIDVQKGQDPSATVNSIGDITYGAGILDTVFPFLDYQGSLQVYSYTSPNLLGGGSSDAPVSV
jgi:hypothetical protein